MAPLHREFEWDDDKAAKNVRKHGVRFEDAADILADPDGDRFHLNRFDPRHDETRIITTLSDYADRSVVYVIVWTDRSTPQRQITRIISARVANKREKKRYEDRNRG